MLGTQPRDAELSPDQQEYIQEVVDFIDAPLSPTSLDRLRAARQGDARAPPGAPAADGGGETIVAGSRVETHSLQNNPEFNGLRGVVVGFSQDGSKVIIEFEGGEGQLYNMPPHNVRGTGPAAPADPAHAATATPQYDAAPPPAPAAPSQQQGSPQQAEIAALQDRLRAGMSTVQAAREAMDVATELYVRDVEALCDVIAEFQPALSRQGVARNWRRIVGIYQSHAERVERSIIDGGALARGAPPGPGGGAPQPATYSTADGGDLAAQLEGVLNFIDEPLSPHTLASVREIRRGLSPGAGSPGRSTTA